MDEPLASLDMARRHEILSYIELLRDRLRIPIVFVSHSVPEVTRLADLLVLLSDGRVVAAGDVHDVMNRLDLRPHTGRYEAGAVIESQVLAHDAEFGLTTLAFDGGQLAAAANRGRGRAAGAGAHPRARRVAGHHAAAECQPVECAGRAAGRT